MVDIIITTVLVGLGSVLVSRSINICMMEGLHELRCDDGPMEVTNETETIDDDVTLL